MEQHSYGSTQPQREGLGDGCSNSQPVCQLVDTVTKDDEPGQWLDVGKEVVDSSETTCLLLTVSFPFLLLILCVDVLSMSHAVQAV